MNKPLILSLASLAVVFAAGAEALSPSQALSRALDARDGVRKMQSHVGKNALKLIHSGTKLRNTDASAYYVFTPANGEGFIVASGDTRMRPLLAQADSGKFSTTDMPENLRYWLSTYEAEIQALDESASTSSGSIFDAYATWQPIEPLVKTEWDQNGPYNDLAPVVNGNTCLAGCVPVAMAQVVKAIGYYNGKGSNTYTNPNHKVEVSFDFESWKPDFSKMLNNYDMENYSAEQAHEVAMLVKACGVAVNVGYGPDATGGNLSRKAMVDYLGFDPSSQIISRSLYKTAEWETLIYDQLSIGRPLYYSGSGNGGHAFVCDGYSSNGLFHINWGWGGVSNGYFALSALVPDVVGAGGASGGYSLGQNVGIFVVPGSAPAPENSKGGAPLSVQWNANGFGTPTTSGAKDTFSLYHRVPSTPTGGSVNVALTLQLIDPDGKKDDIIIPGNYTAYSPGTTKNNYTVDFSTVNLAPGEYLAYPVYQVEGYNGYWSPTQAGGTRSNQDHWRLTIGENGKRKYVLETMVNPGIELYDLSTNDVYAGDYQNMVYFTVTNTSNRDFGENLSLHLINSDGKDQGEIVRLCLMLPAGSSTTMSSNFDVKSAGKYTIRLYRNTYSLYLGNNTLEFEAKSGERPSDKGIEPNGNAQIGLWLGENVKPVELSETVLAAGGTISGTTAFLYGNGRSFSYDFAVFAKGDTSKPVWSQHIADNRNVTDYGWSKGDPFSVTPILAPGVYTMAFISTDGKFMSYPADLIVCIDQDGLLYRINADGKTVSLWAVNKNLAGEVEIPATIKYDGTEYVVNTIAANALAYQYGITAVTIPASVESIKTDAFRGCTGLKTVTLLGARVPFNNSILPFYGAKEGLTFHVPAEALNDYAKVITTEDHILHREPGETPDDPVVPEVKLTDITVPSEISIVVGQWFTIPVTLVPAEATDVELQWISTDMSVVTVSKDGQAYGVKAGEAGIAVSNADGSITRKITVTVTDEPQTGIDKIKSDANAVAPLYDLQGRRVGGNTRHGLYIQSGRLIRL